MARITALRADLVGGFGMGGDYHRQADGHWIVDLPIPNLVPGYAQ